VRRRAGDDGGSRRPAAVDDVGDDHRDVVGAASAQGQLQQPLAGRLRVGHLQRLLQRVEAADRTGQPVGAEQVPVARSRLAHRQVGSMPSRPSRPG
jgi:hypothetical protein